MTVVSMKNKASKNKSHQLLSGPHTPNQTTVMSEFFLVDYQQLSSLPHLSGSLTGQSEWRGIFKFFLTDSPPPPPPPTWNCLERSPHDSAITGFVFVIRRVGYLLDPTFPSVSLLISNSPPPPSSLPIKNRRKQKQTWTRLGMGSAVAQSVERATPGEEVMGLIPTVAARSLLVGSVTV